MVQFDSMNNDLFDPKQGGACYFNDSGGQNHMGSREMERDVVL